MFNTILSRIAAVLLSLTLCACGSQSNHEKKPTETLTVGLQSGYPPFEFMNAEGQIVGFDIDVAKIIAEKLGKKLAIVDMEFEGEILSLKQGKIDLIISGMNITPSRQKEILMVPYHGDDATAFSLIFWKAIPSQITELEDFSKIPNAIISVESGSIPEMYMQQFPQIKVKSFQGSLSPLMDVKFGKSLANIVQPDVANYLKQQHPEIVILNVPVSPENKIEGFGIGVKKDNFELYNKIDAIVKELKESGELQKLESKWFKAGQ